MTGERGRGAGAGQGRHGIPSLTSDEAVDLGLCFDWISGERMAWDDTYYLQKYAPLRPRSNSSALDVRKVVALTAAGRMRPSGQAEAEGRWGSVSDGEQAPRRR